jgi:hypothetical protein
VKDVTALTQPLVTRPPYGERERTVAESGLPEGSPAKGGIPLDPSIPGSQTFTKPLDDKREFDQPKDKSIYEVENADDLLGKDRMEINEDNADKHDGIGGWGKGKPNDSGKTKYPYRDDIPNEKSAYVVQAYLADLAPVVRIQPGAKIAVRMDAIIEGLNPKYVDRASRCSVSTARADRKNLRWRFSVDCGNGPKVVKVKASRKGNITKFSKMDLDITCSCPAWRWQGPEHWGKEEDYLDGKPRGTASFPIIRDPSGINRVCKHVAAVLARTKAWDVAK